MKKIIAIIKLLLDNSFVMRGLSALLAASLCLMTGSYAYASEPKSGKNCTKVNSIQVYRGKTYTCQKIGQKLVWGVGISVTKQGTSLPQNSQTPFTQTESKSCSGTAPKSDDKYSINIQLMNPFNNSQVLNGGGIFLKENSEWIYMPANISGEVKAQVSPGNYEISTLPPMRTEFYFERNSYFLNVLANGNYNIDNSKSLDNHCQIYSKLSPSGINRFNLVSSKNFQKSIASLAINRPMSTVKYIAPISNRLGRTIEFDLYPWESKHFVLLTLTNIHNPDVMGRLLNSLDSSYELYDSITSKFPKMTPLNSIWARTINGKEVIAEIPDVDGQDSSKIISCGGNACTAVSTLGIEIRWQILEETLFMLENLDVYDHTLFYELGRTFWPQNSCFSKISLKSNDPTVTGFAVLMRYVMIKQLHLDLSSDDNVSGDVFFEKILGLEKAFSENPELNLANVFTENRLINGFDGNAIWASLFYYLGANYGGINFYTKFFSSCDALQTSKTNEESLQNWKKLAESSAGLSLSAVFNSRWRLP